MADSYKGLIIRIGGDTSGLTQALKASNKAINTTQKQLKQLERASKLDTTGTTALKERLDLMGDRAQALTTKLTTMNRTLAKMDGSKIKLLSEMTSDAAYNAQALTSKYAAVIDKIKALKNQIAKTTLGDAFNVNDVETDPFTKLNNEGKNLLGTVAQVKAKIRELNGVSTDGKNDTAQVKQQIAAYERLVAEFKKVSAAKKLASEAAEFKDMQVEIASTRAQARALYQQMQKLASENPAATQTVAFRNLSEKLSALGSEATQLKSRLSGLDEAMKLDPTNIDVAKARLQTLSQSVQVNQTRVAALRSELKQLDTADGSISALANSSRNLASELYAANSRCTSLRERIAELKSETGATNQAEKVAALESKLSEAASQANRLATAMRYSSVNAELQTVSASTNALSNSMSGALTKSSQFRGVLQNVGWTLTSTISPAVLMFGHYAVNAADEVDSAYRDMRKTVQGTEQQFESLKQAALDYSRTHVTSADTILEIEAMGGQLGVATSKLESFATVVSNLDIATDLDADTAAEQLGQLSGILNDMTDNDFAKYGDALTRLGNNNSTLESKISDVMLRISSMGTITGFTTPQLLAWSTAVAATGQGSEAAGTAISKTMSDIESAVGAGGDKLQNFATVAGMSATEFASKWKSDPSEAMQSFIQGLKQVEAEGGSADNTLTNLGITSVRQKQAILGLTQTIDTLSDNLTMSQDAWDGVSDQWGDAGDAAREAERKAEGFSGAISILQNNAQALGTEMGSELTPLIQSLAGVVATVTAAYSGASSATKLFVNGLLALVAGGGTALVFLAGLLNALNAIKTTVAASLTMKAAAEGMQLASTAASGLKVALGLVAEAYLTSASASEKAAAKEMLVSEASGVAATATKVLSAALKTLPWVAVVAGAALVISKLVEFNSQQETARAAVTSMQGALEVAEAGFEGYGEAAKLSTDEVVSSANDALSSTKELGESLKSSFSEVGSNNALLNTYVDTINRLAGNCDGSAGSVWELKNAVDGYNEITGESVSVINSQTGELSQSTDEINKNAEAWKLNAESQAYSEAYADTVKQRAKNEEELAKVEKQLADKENELNDSGKTLAATNADGTVAFSAEKAEVLELRDKADQLRAAVDECSESEDYWQQKAQELAEKQKAQSQSTSEAASAADLYAAALGKTSDEFSELVTETTKVVDGSTGMQQLFQQTGLSADEFAYSLSMLGIDASDLASQMESMSDTVQNAFSEMSTGEDISVQTMIENLQKNASTANEWSANITDLYQRAGDAGKSFVDYIAEQGPQYATAVANLKDATDDELQEVIAAYNDAGYASMNAAATGANANADTIKATATELGKQVSTSFQEGVSSTDGTGAGQQQAQEVVMGMESGADAFSAGVGTGSDYSEGVSSTEGDAASSGDTIATASEEQVTLAQQTFWQIGASIGSNYAEGIYSKTGEAASAGTAIAMSAADSCGKGSATAYQWGAHLGSNFAEGIYSKTGEASAAGAALAAAAGESTHFSVPKKGIWSGAEKGGWRSGTHLVQNFAQGIRDQIPELSSAAQEAAQAAAVALNGGKYQANLASATNYAQASVSPAKVTVSVKDANEAVTGWLDKNLPSIIADNAPNLVIDNDAGRMVVDARLNQLQRKAAMNRG